MNLSNAFLRVGVLFGLVGISLGYYMGASQEFTASPVHAHVNLLGWVAMFLYGLFYRAQPSAAVGLVPKIHFWTNVAGVLVMTTALAAYLLHVQGLESYGSIGLIVGPTLVLLSMLMFVWIVFRHTGKDAATA
ncbi:hypothetical protein [Brevundimonas sp.]|uniref:hypothetical protein n=1 Tax=Brevundimonas sp. TaxID=1871086 RepID=UPI0025D1DB83|nr:hypothetical protein [Brevundimonas sp.]